MLYGYLVLNIWYQSKTILGFDSFKLVILAFSLPIFLGEVSGFETWKDQQGSTEEDSVQVSVLDSLYFLRYTIWKLGFVTSPKSLSQTVVLGKTSISEAKTLQIKCHLLHWKEYKL